MEGAEKILIVHDTFYKSLNENFSYWIDDFRKNISSASMRLPGPGREFTLSSDLVEFPEDVAEPAFKDYDYFLVIIHEEIGRTQNLRDQFNNLLAYLKGLPDYLQAQKTTLLFLREHNLDQEILQIRIEKIVKFYSRIGLSPVNQGGYISSTQKEYWDILLHVLDLVSSRADVKLKKRTVRKQPTIVYIGLTSPDLEGQRQILTHELDKMGMEVLPEIIGSERKETDRDTTIDLLEYSDLIIQMIGGVSGEKTESKGKTRLEQEHELITRFMSGENRRSIGIQKKHSRIIWLPGQIEIRDTPQQKFIEHIRKQISYSDWDTEVITGTFEQFKNFVLNSLKRRIPYSIPNTAPPAEKFIYLIHEKSVYQEALEIAFQLRNYSLHIIMTHDLYLQENFIRAHIETLRSCDAVLVYYGLNNVYWYESIIKEIIKTGRNQHNNPFSFKAVIYHEDPVYHIEKYQDFLYLSIPELMSQDFFKQHLKKIIG